MLAPLTRGRAAAFSSGIGAAGRGAALQARHSPPLPLRRRISAAAAAGPSGSPSAAPSAAAAKQQQSPVAPSAAASAAAAVAVAEPALAAASGEDSFEQRLQAAYEAGYRKGYLHGVQVTVDVDVTASQDGGANAKAGGDSVAKSAVKGLVWRLFSTTATVGVALVVMGDALKAQDALKFGGIEFCVKWVMYFLFERLWLALA